MALITGLAIEEAKDMELADGGVFGDNLFGRQVIEAAAELLQQQSQQASDQLPLGEFFERREDMGQGRLRLILDGDSDVCLAVISSEGEMADVEFCVPFSGGGRSPKVRDALLALARAIRDENASNPIEQGESPALPFGTVSISYAVAAREGGSHPFADDPWNLLPGTLMFEEDAACSHARALANAGDSETEYTAVKIRRSGVKPVGETHWGVRGL